MEILNMASTIPLPTISPTITGSATIGPPPVTSVIPTSTSLPGNPHHAVFESATKTGHITLWIAFAAFVVITVIFTILASRIEKHQRLFHYLTILTTVTASLSYFTMAAGGGWSFQIVNTIHHHDNPVNLIFRQVYWARYIDWTITGPLLLANLTLLAGLPGAEVILSILAIKTMVIFGLFSALSHTEAKWGYYTISCILFLYVVYALVVSSRRAAIARSAKVGQLVTSMSLYVIILWALYPVVWALGVGTRIISVDQEIIIYTVLDILVKGVFGGWLLVSHVRIPEGRVPLTGWWSEGAGRVEGSAAERRRLLDDD